MKRLVITGTPDQIGVMHGLQARREIHRSLQTYEQLFHSIDGLNWRTARQKACEHLKAIEQYDESLLEEMQGIAKGASVDFEDILALNARSEIFLTNVPDGCTSFAIRSSQGEMWLAQNWDWRGTQQNALLHLQIQQKGKPNIQMVTEAGMIGKIGRNDAGIGVCLNALVTNCWQPKVPIHLGLRAILNATSFDEAINCIRYNQMASPAHFLIATKEGRMTSAEVSPLQTELLKPAGSFLAHTNHLCSMILQQRLTERAKSDSFRRLQRMTTMLTDLPLESLHAELLFQLLSDHEHYPDAICRHLNEQVSPMEQMETLFSIVMNLTAGESHIRKGHPCLLSMKADQMVSE